MAATHCQPILEEQGWLTIRGGMLRKGVCHIPVTNVRWGDRRLRFMRVVQRDTQVAQLLTGRPACGRPLKKMKIWKHIRSAIDASGLMSSAASAADDDLGFAEDLGVEEEETEEPPKKKARHRVRGLDFVKIDVDSVPGSSDEGTRSIVFENKAEISMDVGQDLENLTWLMKAVLQERRDPAAIALQHARLSENAGQAP